MLEPYTWTLRVTSSAKDKATVFARKQQFTVGAPLSFDEAHPHVTALEYVFGALAAELLNGLRAVAAEKRVIIDAAEASVNAQLHDALAHLAVVGQGGSPAISRIAVKVYVGSLDEEEKIRALWEETLRRSPLWNTLKGSVQLELTLKVSL